MRIELEEAGRVKITLNPDDMKNYDITFSELDYNQIDTKRIIWQLLLKARNQTGFEFSSGNLLVEAFPASSGGCVLYFTNILYGSQMKRIKIKKSCFGPYVFRFESAEEMLTAVSRLGEAMGFAFMKSALYEAGEHYFLALYPVTRLEEEARILLGEYGDFFCEGAPALAFIEEHGTLICAPNAVETISAAMARR